MNFIKSVFETKSKPYVSLAPGLDKACYGAADFVGKIIICAIVVTAVVVVGIVYLCMA